MHVVYLRPALSSGLIRSLFSCFRSKIVCVCVVFGVAVSVGAGCGVEFGSGFASLLCFCFPSTRFLVVI